MVVRRASRRITLVLIGSAASLAACGPDPMPAYQRDLYASKEDCVADWGRPESCDSAPGTSAGSGGYHYRGPIYPTSYRDDAQRAERERARSEGHMADTSPSDRSVARQGPGGTPVDASGTARRGFGSSGRSLGSWGG